MFKSAITCFFNNLDNLFRFFIEIFFFEFLGLSKSKKSSLLGIGGSKAGSPTKDD